MPGQTWAQWSATWLTLAKFKQQAQVLAENNGSDDFVSLQNSLLTALKGDTSRDVLAGVASMRASLNDLILNTAAMDAHLEDLDKLTDGTFVASAASGPAARLEQLRRYMIANSKTVASRAFTYGAPTAGGSNTGSGVLLRLVTGPDGYDLEATPIGGWEARCIADANTGAVRNAERFSVRDTLALGDAVEFQGGGTVGELTALGNAGGRNLLTNPGFDSRAGDASAPSSLPGWTTTATGGTEYQLDSTNTFLPKIRSTENRYSLRIDADSSYTQRLDSANAALKRGVPLVVVARVGRSFGSGDGTVTLDVGARSASLASGSASAGWNHLYAPVTPSGNLWQTSGDRLYYDYLKEDPFTFGISLASRTTGYWNVDDIVVAPMTQIGAHWYCLLAGATPFFAGLEAIGTGDTFSWSDSLSGSEAVRQYWMYRDYGESMPHDGTPSESDS